MVQLRSAIEQASGITLHAPCDYDQLSSMIFEQQHATISASTLKRLWGYAGQETKPRVFTLNVLARFVGYKDFKAFEESVGAGEAEQSNFSSPTRLLPNCCLKETTCFLSGIRIDAMRDRVYRKRTISCA